MMVGWDATHGEFTIEDYYYFSKLKTYAENEGIKIDEVRAFSKLANYDIIVFNYPELRFKVWEINRIKSWIKRGKRVIFATYYNNHDNVAEIINHVLQRMDAGIKINSDVIVDSENNFSNDRFFPIAKFKDMTLVMPCSASIAAKDAEILVKGLPTAKTLPEGNESVFAVRKKMGDGELIVLGTCVFWDNYSLDVERNRDFALWLLKR